MINVCMYIYVIIVCVYVGLIIYIYKSDVILRMIGILVEKILELYDYLRFRTLATRILIGKDSDKHFYYKIIIFCISGARVFLYIVGKFLSMISSRVIYVPVCMHDITCYRDDDFVNNIKRFLCS